MNNAITEYYQQIVDGTAIVGKFIRMLFEKLTNGLADGTYVYVEEEADNAITWIEQHCFHVKGFLAPSRFKLELWQKALVSAMFGIYDPETNKRQFREVLLVIGRKNGKSLLASAIAKYVLFEAGGYGARVYCTAPKLDQADLVYSDAWRMVELDPEWQAEEKAITDSIKGHNRKTYDDSGHCKRTIQGIAIDKTNALMKKQAFSVRKSDGFDPSLVVCDEIASWSGDAGLKQYEVWKSAGGAREMGQNPLIILSCTTSGYENDSIYDELVKRSTRFLMGESKEKRLLPFLYMIDDVAKWNDIDELRKSNPNLGVSVSPDYLKEEISVALGSLSKKAEFITKYACIKQNSSLAWLAAETVQKACGDELRLEDFRGSYCVCGVDLSRTTDLTSACCVIEKNGELYVFSKFYLPSEKIDEATTKDGLPYRAYITRGLLEPSGGNFIDYTDCMRWLKSLVEEYELYPLQVGYDRYNANYLTQEMEHYGFHVDDVYQGYNLTPVIREVEGLMKDGKIHIGNNDLLKVHLLDTALKVDSEKEKCMIVKLNNNSHIDGVAAMLDAFTVRQKWWNDIGERLKNGE